MSLYLFFYLPIIVNNSSRNTTTVISDLLIELQAIYSLMMPAATGYLMLSGYRIGDQRKSFRLQVFRNTWMELFLRDAPNSADISW